MSNEPFDRNGEPPRLEYHSALPMARAQLSRAQAIALILFFLGPVALWLLVCLLARR
jgi:hypothetical protein